MKSFRKNILQIRLEVVVGGKLKFGVGIVFQNLVKRFFRMKGCSPYLFCCLLYFCPKDSRAFAHVIVKQEEGGKVEDHPYVHGLVVGPGKREPWSSGYGRRLMS